MECAEGMQNMIDRMTKVLLWLSATLVAGMALCGGIQVLWAAEPDAWTQLFHEGVKAREAAHYAEAEPLLQQALHEAEQARSEDGRVATAANNLGLLYHDQGRLAEARALRARPGHLGNALGAGT